MFTKTKVRRIGKLNFETKEVTYYGFNKYKAYRALASYLFKIGIQLP